jgi:hypothetical protein
MLIQVDEREAKIVPGIGKRGREFERPLVTQLRILRAIQIAQCIRAVAPRVGVIGLQCDGLIATRQRVRRTAEIAQNAGPVAPCLREFRPQFQRMLEARQRFGGRIEPRQRVAAIVQRIDEIALQCKCPICASKTFLEPAQRVISKGEIGVDWRLHAVDRNRFLEQLDPFFDAA